MGQRRKLPTRLETKCLVKRCRIMFTLTYWVRFPDLVSSFWKPDKFKLLENIRLRCSSLNHRQLQQTSTINSKMKHLLSISLFIRATFSMANVASKCLYNPIEFVAGLDLVTMRWALHTYLGTESG